jgi:hypothetical protein
MMVMEARRDPRIYQHGRQPVWATYHEIYVDL